MLLAILFFCLPLYFVRAAVSCTVQYIFGFGFSLAAPLDALLAAAGYAVYQQHLLEVILDCVWKLGCWLFDGVFSSFAAGTPVSRSARNVSEPSSLAACISLGIAARAAAVCADPPVVPSRSVTKRLSSLALDPSAFFVKPMPVSPTGMSILAISSAGRADRWVNCAAAGGRRVSFSGALSLSGLSSAAIDPGHPTTSAISSCRRVGGVRRRATAFACSLRARGNCRVAKSGRRSSGVSLRRNLARAFKAADILGISSGISLLSSFRGAAANACQLLRVTSCAKKVNTGLFLASAPAVTPATGKRNASSAARHVPRFPAAGGRVNKPVVAGATARRMRRAGVEDALRLHQSHSAATVSASRAAVTAAATSLWSGLTAMATAAVLSASSSSRGAVPRLPASARVQKPVAKSATQRRLRRAGVKEALCLHQSRLGAAGAAARAASAVREKEIAARPIRAISRRRALVSVAAGSTVLPPFPPATTPSSVKVLPSSLPAAAVRPTALSVPDVVLAAAASLAQKNRAAGAFGVLPATGSAFPVRPMKPKNRSVSRRGVPSANTANWNPVVPRGPWQPQRPVSS